MKCSYCWQLVSADAPRLSIPLDEQENLIQVFVALFLSQHCVMDIQSCVQNEVHTVNSLRVRLLLMPYLSPEVANCFMISLYLCLSISSTTYSGLVLSTQRCTSLGAYKHRRQSGPESCCVPKAASQKLSYLRGQLLSLGEMLTSKETYATPTR